MSGGGGIIGKHAAVLPVHSVMAENMISCDKKVQDNL